MCDPEAVSWFRFDLFGFISGFGWTNTNRSRRTGWSRIGQKCRHDTERTSSSSCVSVKANKIKSYGSCLKPHMVHADNGSCTFLFHLKNVMVYDEQVVPRETVGVLSAGDVIN